MRYKKLAVYGKLKVEERVLMDELAALKRNAVVTDTVKGSHMEFPYTMHTITVSGIPPEDSDRIRSERKRLRTRLGRVRKEMRKIEGIIDAAEDPVMRAVLKKKILDGMSWRETADAVYGFGVIHENTVRMMVLRWCEKMK